MCQCNLATASKSIQGTSKHEKTYFVHFVHFCTCTFGKNLVAMYKNGVGPPPGFKGTYLPAYLII